MKWWVVLSLIIVAILVAGFFSLNYFSEETKLRKQLKRSFSNSFSLEICGNADDLYLSECNNVVDCLSNEFVSVIPEEDLELLIDSLEGSSVNKALEEYFSAHKGLEEKLDSSQTKCLSKSVCVDTDGGKAPYLKGNVLSSQIHEDICVYGDNMGGYSNAGGECSGDNCFVMELYCDKWERSEEISCLNGCSDGACIRLS